MLIRPSFFIKPEKLYSIYPHRLSIQAVLIANKIDYLIKHIAYYYEVFIETFKIGEADKEWLKEILDATLSDYAEMKRFRDQLDIITGELLIKASRLLSLSEHDKLYNQIDELYNMVFDRFFEAEKYIKHMTEIVKSR